MIIELDKKYLLIIPLAFYSISGHADNARDWQNTPVDLNFLFGYYSLVDGNTPIDTALPVDGLSLNANIYIVRFARSFALDGRNTAFQIIQPYGDVEASFDDAQFFTGTKNRGGMGDTQLVFAHNFFGGPALTVEEFSSWTAETFLSGAMTVITPTGDYDGDRIINIGSNRWVFKPEIAFGTPLGPTWLEFNAYVSLYGDNDDYFNNRTLEQKPLYAIEAHYSYTVNRALWAGIDAIYNIGGETEIDSIDQSNEQENVLLGASMGFMLSPAMGGLVAYTNTVSERSGSPDVDTWTFRLQYIW